MLPAAFSFAPILAQATADSASKLDASNPTVFMGLFIAAVGALALTADRVDSMVQRRKRKPSVDVDLVGLSSAIQTLTTTVNELKEAKDSHNGHKERIAALEARCTELKGQLERELATQRSYIAKTHKDITEQIDEVKRSVSQNFQEVERGLGRVEGALAQIAAK